MKLTTNQPKLIYPDSQDWNFIGIIARKKKKKKNEYINLLLSKDIKKNKHLLP